MIRKILIGTAVCFFWCNQAHAYWMWTPETNKWLNPKWAVKSTPEDQFIWATEQYEAGDYERAAKEFSNLCVYYPFSDYAQEAQFLAGESYMKSGNYYDGFLEFQKLVENFPTSTRINEALDKEFQIGNHFFHAEGPGWKTYVPIVPGKSNYEIALEIYQKIIKNAPFCSVADDAQYRIGDTYIKVGNYSLAIEAYEKLIATYPDSELAELASYKIAMSKSEGLYGTQGDHSARDESLEDFEAFSKEYPDSSLMEEAKKEIDFLKNENAQKLYDIGLFYEKNKGYKAAEFYYQKLADDYQGTRWAKEAGGRLQKIAPRLKAIREKEE